MNRLRTMLDTRDQIQKIRVRFGNRIDAVIREVDTYDEQSLELLQRYYSEFLNLERQLDADIANQLKDESIYEALISIKGIGPKLAAKLLALIDIRRADTVSALWRYAGYAVIDGKSEQPTRGEKLHYNKRLKTACYLIAKSFLSSDSPYRRVYDEAKVHYEKSRPGWTKMRRHLAAMRKMVKVFLSHLWVRWRELEHLPVSKPYPIDILQHNTYYHPEEFGWS